MRSMVLAEQKAENEIKILMPMLCYACARGGMMVPFSTAINASEGPA
jgi:hypothetical protein